MDSKQRLLELRYSTGMNRREFAEYFEIPYRTVQEWELGNRKMPEYLLRLMAYKVRIENENGILNIQRDKELNREYTKRGLNVKHRRRDFLELNISHLGVWQKLRST